MHEHLKGDREIKDTKLKEVLAGDCLNVVKLSTS